MDVWQAAVAAAEAFNVDAASGETNAPTLVAGGVDVDSGESGALC